MKNKAYKIIIAFLVISVILRFSFVLIHLNYDCDHTDECPTCNYILKYRNSFNGIRPIILVLLISLVLTKYINKVIRNNYNEVKTLITLQVRLNN